MGGGGWGERKAGGGTGRGGDVGGGQMGEQGGDRLLMADRNTGSKIIALEVSEGKEELG